MKTVIAFRAAACAVLLPLVVPSSVQAGLLQTFDFETGDLSRLEGIEIDGPTASVTASTDFARRGRYSMKAFINKADKRAEGVCTLRGTVGGVNWYGWSVYVPDNQHGDGKFDIISQFHDWHTTLPAWADDGTAPTNLTLGEDNMLRFSLKYQGPVNPVTGNPTTVHQVFNLAPCTVGTWHDFVVNVKWTHLSDGFLKVWLNGDLLVDYTGPTYMDYGAGKGPYFKMGDYKGVYNWSGTGPRYFYMDEFRMGGAGSTYDEVNPAQVAPTVYEGFNYAPGSIAGLDGGRGWLSGWSQSGGAGQHHVISGGFTYADLVSTGNRFRIYDTDGNLQTVTRPLAGTAGEIPGTYWISFLAKKIASGRESYIKFGGLHFAAVGSYWQVKTAGTAYATLTGAGTQALHLIVARVDAGAVNDTVRVWVDPVLSAGEPSTGSALVTLTDAAFNFNTVTIQYGPLGKSTQAGEWDEIRIGRDFASVLRSTVDVETATDGYVRGGTQASDRLGLSPSLLVNLDATDPKYTYESYLRFNLGGYQGNLTSAKLVLMPSQVGTSIANATFQVLLVSNDTWQEQTMTWNNRPAAGTVVATIAGSSIQVGQPLEVDVTSAAVQEKAGDGKLSLVIVATVAGSQRQVTFRSYQFGAGGPVLRLK
ncbi:MAG: hypothetical protein K0R17_39 [Rariglobus sp.]|jgi:hypothetical protein|nr:hypothetical protein [Rariglobus sp.]